MVQRKKKYLDFQFRGERYVVDEKGRIAHFRTGALSSPTPSFSDTWIFLGGSKHHISNRIDVHLPEAFDNPSLLENCLGWDRDHGTVRQWGGRYNGKLPRITDVTVTDRIY